MAVVDQPAYPEGGLQPQSDLGQHVGELQLDDLGRGERPAELLAIERIAACRLETRLGSAHRAPGDAITRAVEATERALQSLDIGEQRVLADLDLVHDDFAGDRRAQR